MPTTTAIQNALKQVNSQSSFFSALLNQTLGWPVADAQKMEDISYSWSADDLHAVELERDLIDGVVWQIQPLEHGQPWGIFVLEFKNAKLFTAGRGMASVLRKILRGLVSSRRKQAALPSWKREHLLFICTYGWQRFRFGYFRAKPEDPRGSRLTTFGWEPGSSNRTVCEFNLPALVWPDDSLKSEKWVADWAKAFDKERLTNDFFKRFDQALVLIKSDLQEFQKLKADEAYTQAQLLLERLIFLYFLQNRGWLKQDSRYLPNGLQEHVKKPDAFSYYGEFLEKVFWSLSTPPLSSGERVHGLPFLNGGLFDDDEFDPSERRKKTSPPLKVRNGTLGNVFRDLLEAFNFTVTEDTPLNQEVAVDPEMLGKVFESIVLHAEQADPDATAPDKRKATGSYYTPRIVVHFICQEVLSQHLSKHLSGNDWSLRLRTLLAIDISDGIDESEREILKKTITADQAVEALKLVKPLRCCDPAVGSGAFPVGLLHELVNLRRILQTAANGYVDPVRKEGSSWLQNSKQEIVQNCLFGVDIQQQAIEICRLRLWLSLVVDYDLGLDPFKAEKTEFNRAIDGISQLPNLEMNFHRGDSLHDHISGVPIVIMPEKASHYSEDFEKIAKLGGQLHRAKRAERKRKLRVQILEKRLDLSRRILEEEIRSVGRDESSLTKLFHDETDSSSNKRKRIAQEKSRLQDALVKIEKDGRELEKLAEREFDNQFYVKLRKLEGADFDSPFNFAWFIDFPGIFGSDNGAKSGFDIIVANPPFVTARNPKKRELWRERWPRVSSGTYQMLCPFFELSFGLLKPGGELGFIISNAFAKREFGIPLVTKLFPEKQVQKIVDCSGLMFPGHGTPTWIVYAGNQTPTSETKTRVTVTLPGGGDLRTPPEESPLWQAISKHNDVPEFTDERIAVHDWNVAELLRWPMNLDYQAEQLRRYLETKNNTELKAEISGNIGRVCFTGADEIYFIPPDLVRRCGVEESSLSRFVVGDVLRNWSHIETTCICPYGRDGKLLQQIDVPNLLKYLRHWRDFLRMRLSYGETQEERGLAWWEYSIVFPERITGELAISLTEIATHNHAEVICKPFIANRANPILDLKVNQTPENYHLVASILNSAAAIFWLKQVCYNKGAGEDEHRDRFEYAGGKVEQLPVPESITLTLHGKQNELAERLTQLSLLCSERGRKMPSLALRKLFEKPDEGYQGWNETLPDYVGGDVGLGSPFDSSVKLREAYQKTQIAREQLRTEMIALQEEMDWLVYAAYGLLPKVYAEVRRQVGPTSLDREDRPFCLWARAKGEYLRAVELVPIGWSQPHRDLWKARLADIRDSADIRRIEQPVYKRRWDEQWKVGNKWCCGPIAYAAEFVEAFEWWLSEKAEWWLETKKNGGPVEFDDWAQALWKDARVRAAWPVAAEEYTKLQYDKALEKTNENDEPAPSPITPATDFMSFRRELKRIVDEETVTQGIPFGVPFEELEEKLKRKIPGNIPKVRGKLNVPRERFHLRDKTQYLWAGLQFKH
jgi:hypothetical protein